jgi:nucleoside-diphosphate-sugar epimerase
VTRALAERIEVDVVPVARRPLRDGVNVRKYSEAPAGDVLVHLAQDPDRSRVNAAGATTENSAVDTVKGLLSKRYHRVVFASSAAVYGHASDQPHSPNDEIVANDAYARMKLRCEREVQDHGGAAVRLANAYGPGMAATNVLGIILSQIPGEGPLRVQDVLPVRDFLWVDEAAEGFARLACGEFELPPVVHLGTGVGTSVGEAARIALRIAGEENREVIGTGSSPAKSTVILDFRETTRLCGWRPEVNVHQGLSRMLQHQATIS